MRLHRLEMTAFGPFAESTVINFDELGADGLFLLHGPTGAGKTTVLDAIAFALYGKVPGARGESKRLHSDHAPDQTPPQVTLEATLGGRRIRLTRIPEFERPKLRGTGMRTDPAKATLTWLDGRGENLSRIPDIGDEIIRLLGMSADQFFQVVLLPQGDFARFLRAENEDREKLLEKLFDTERFGSAEQWLADRRRASSAEVESRKQGIDRLIAQVGVAAGVGATESVGALEAVGWSQDLLAVARTDLTTTATESERRQQESTRVRAAAEEQRRLHDLRRRMTTAQQQLDNYTAATAHRTDLTVELEAARRAAPVAEAIDEARAAVMLWRRGQKETLSAAQRLAGRLVEPGSADLDGGDLLQYPTVDGGLAAFDAEGRGGSARVLGDADARTAENVAHTAAAGPSGARGDDAHPTVREDADLDAAVRQWSARVGALDEVRADVTVAERLTAELVALGKDAEAFCDRAGQLAERRAQLPAAIALVEARLRASTDAVAILPALAADCERLQATATAAVELATRRTALDHSGVDFEKARATHNDAKERVLDLRERRLAGMAAELAGELREGQPCTVCGSADHPDPAQPTDAAVFKETEEAAMVAERAAEAARDKILAHMSGLEREIEALIARGGNTDRVELAAALRSATNRYEDTAESAALADELTAELSRLRADETRLHDEIRDCESRRSTITTRIAAAETRRTELTDRLRAAAGADKTIDRRHARLTALVSDATTLREVRVATENAREQVTAVADRVESLALAAGFVADVSGDRDDVALLTAYARAVTAAARTPQRQAEIEGELTAADRARAHAEAVLAEPEIKAAGSAELADPEETAALVASAQSALNAAVAAHAEANRRTNLLEELGGQLWAAVDRIAPLQRAHEELAGLAEVVAGRGANNRRMSLRSYVLAARLEEVALAGSVRLRRMSGGRYEFVHTDKAGPRGRRGGLGLDIRDDYTGTIRPAKTLSGGETFMAALALALGLADTVAAESGGIVLDTLFIDEGFGGLDADSLDAVMGVLDELRAGGRVVGVVSHVDEMRQRIPSRLHVRRGRVGSHLETTVA